MAYISFLFDRILTSNGYKNLYDSDADRRRCDQNFRELERVFKRVGFSEDVSELIFYCVYSKRFSVM